MLELHCIVQNLLETPSRMQRTLQGAEKMQLLGGCSLLGQLCSAKNRIHQVKKTTGQFGYDAFHHTEMSVGS